MSEELFRVVLTGVLTGEFDEPVARQKFAAAFKLNRERVAALLIAGEDRVIKSNVTESVAMTYMIKVLESGYECYVQEMPEEGLNYEEKRTGRERRIRFRRGPRPGAIVPDRRLKIRRKREVRMFLEMLRTKQALTLPFQTYPHKQD